MTAFTKSNLHFNGEYLTFVRSPLLPREFVARFKHFRPSENAAAFRRFLIKNFTVEEYFAARVAGEAPLTILRGKGFVSPNERRAMTFGYELKSLRSHNSELSGEGG